MGLDACTAHDQPLQMLLRPMRRSLTCLGLLLSMFAFAQVEIDGSIQFTGPSDQRGIDDLGRPTEESAAVTVEASLVGTTTWADASVSGTVVTLTPVVPMDGYRDGALLRFLAPTDLHGAITLGCASLPAVPLTRPDGLPAARGQIVTGAIVEIVHANGSWILMGLSENGCPPGTAAIGERLCMERASQPNSLWFPASDRCNDLGGRLCSWDEFYVACTQYASEFTSMLSAWEWLDDSSNHANSAVQVGMTTCTAERWANPNNVTLGRSRCCFTPR